MNDMNQTNDANDANRTERKRKTKPYDPASYLDTPERRAGYARVALEEGGVEPLLIALGNIARSMSMDSIATEAGVSRQSLYRTLSAAGDPKLVNFTNILDAMGLQLSIEPLTQEALDARESNFARPDMVEVPDPSTPAARKVKKVAKPKPRAPTLKKAENAAAVRKAFKAGEKAAQRKRAGNDR